MKGGTMKRGGEENGGRGEIKKGEIASIHYSKYGPAYPLPDHIPATK